MTDQSKPHVPGYVTSREMAEAALTFIRSDDARLAAFLDESALSYCDIETRSISQKVIMRVLQHLIDNSALRRECVQTGVFRSVIPKINPDDLSTFH
jgi:hypothetical protein